MMAENRKLKVAYGELMFKQLAGLQFKYTANKKLQKVENKTSAIHDDGPDSLVILIHIAVKPSRLTPSVTIVGTIKPEENKPLTTAEAAKDYYAQVITQNNSWNKPRHGGGNIW